VTVSTRPEYHLIDRKTVRIQSVPSPVQPPKTVDAKRAGSPSWSPIEYPSRTCCHSGTDRGRPLAAPCSRFPAVCAVPSPANGRLWATLLGHSNRDLERQTGVSTGHCETIGGGDRCCRGASNPTIQHQREPAGMRGSALFFLEVASATVATVLWVAVLMPNDQDPPCPRDDR